MPASTRVPPPARLFFGVFTGFEAAFEWVRAELEREFGPLDRGLDSPAFPFPETRTYSRTMGPDLRRRFFFLERPVPQDGLAAVKRRTIGIEARARAEGRWPVERPVNIDPGLLNDCRVILASTKDFSHRIYRGDGIWEEVTLIYRKGRFEDLPWTYPDLRREECKRYLAEARRRHVRALREGRRKP